MPVNIQEACRMPTKIGPQKNVPLPHNNKNIKFTEQRKKLKATMEKRENNI